MMYRTIVICLSFILPFQTYASSEWRVPEPDDLVYFQLETGTVIIELAPFIAPNHVNRFKQLVDEGFYDGLDFYRVIDGFVAQGGAGEKNGAGEKSGAGEGEDPIQKMTKHKGKLTAEFTSATSTNTDFMLIQSPDFIAPETGYLHGFSAGRDPKTNEQWLLHCPGTVAFARDVDKDSASTEFYITIGQATRHLDRNMSSIGRVIYGMPAVQALKRADINVASGVIENKSQRSQILWAKLATKVPSQKILNIQIQQQNSEAVTKRIQSAKTLDNDFFHFKGNGNLDLCYYQLKTRLATNEPRQNQH